MAVIQGGLQDEDGGLLIDQGPMPAASDTRIH